MGYLDAVIELLQQVRDAERDAIEQAAQVIADAIQKDHLVYVFGPTHAGILAQELFYRAGGLVPVNPHPAARPDHRRAPGHADQPAGAAAGLWGANPGRDRPSRPGMCSSSIRSPGATPSAVEIAQGARERGVFVIAVTSLEYSRPVKPRDASLPRLFEAADLVLDNRAPVGDALVELPGLAQKVGPSSTVTGAAILNAVVARAAELLLERTGDAPVFMSANLDGGDEHNQRWLEKYRGRLTYL